jgi:hypothetical protein
MATIPVTAVNGPYNAAAMSNVSRTACEVAGNKVKLTRKLVVSLRNTGASPYTATFTSQPDPYGRSRDISAHSIAAGAEALFVFEPTGWADSDSNLNFVVNNVAIEAFAFNP